MGLNLNMLLLDEGIPPSEVRLLRHQQSGREGLTPFALWRDDVPEFERYQSVQRTDRRVHFARKYWASFVVPPDGSTLFAGLYEIGAISPVPGDWIDPLMRTPASQAGRELDLYEYRRLSEFDEYSGRLKIEWGAGTRSWSQRADSGGGSKPIVELAQSFREPAFPGYGNFIGNLGALATLPSSWTTALSAVRGIYLLACPRTREQYVGSACGQGGLWGRWQSYVATGHGGNVGLKSRDPADYQVSILEVAGSADTGEDILAMEQLWKTKLRSRDMGLNRN